MAQKPDQGCVSPAKGPLAGGGAGREKAAPESGAGKEERRMTATVGKEAPDFEASAYANGSFANIKLSDYRGKWVTLCFYPGDFTFV